MIDRLIENAFEWAAGHADQGRYSPVAILFHWTMAALVMFQLGWGLWMGRAAPGAQMAGAYEVHYLVGVLMLVLVLGRVGWRLFAPAVINDADKPGWESTAAHVTHYVFYTCLFGLPLSGWAMVSATARETELTLLTLAPWPLLPFGELSNATRWTIETIAEWLHWGLAFSLLAMIPIHVGAALKHHLIDRDDVLHGMLPILPQRPRRRTRWQRRWRALEKRVASLTRPLRRRLRFR
ncbi:cytochrome b [Caulobacter endophyticus]|uniref:cytochrome b n=1 Tax=Caulobacter endophyticus TaxID=2172652 RepID=UPI0024101B85|nr:cytochrome b [Caulobacter endophyticus]MDG2529047.1 cytochrome b [Caulobacter endophyticus]